MYNDYLSIFFRLLLLHIYHSSNAHLRHLNEFLSVVLRDECVCVCVYREW